MPISASGAKVTWSTEVFDTNNNFDLDNERFMPTVAGKYLLTANVLFDNLPNNYNYFVTIRKNGTDYKAGSLSPETGSGNGQSMSTISAVFDANGTTDYFEVYVYTQGACDVYGASNYTYFTGSLIGGGGNVTSSVPAGTISAFNLTTCPIGWIPADGTNSTPDLRGVFIRGMETFDGGTSYNDRDPDRSGSATLGTIVTGKQIGRASCRERVYVLV